jgi:hypothetical protein
MKTSMNFIMNKLQTFQGLEGFSDTLIGRVLLNLMYGGEFYLQIFFYSANSCYQKRKSSIKAKENLTYMNMQYEKIWTFAFICLQRKNS